MQIRTINFVTLASILATACGSTPEEPETVEQTEQQGHIDLNELEIETVLATKVGFTEVESGE